MEKTPLYNAILSYNALGMSSFHTPGHKGRIKELSSLLNDLDLTEIPGLDSLFEAFGVIHQAEMLATKTFGAKRTFFSAGGCTLCIQAMLKLASCVSKKIICPRIIHKSAINAMALLGIEPVFVFPEDNNFCNLEKVVTAKDIEKKLQANQDAKVVYVTSPNYYGIILDIKKISQVCKKYGAMLLVDNAHGAHLNYVSGNLHPIKNGADIVADSAHKTLPVLTGGAFLHINNEIFIGQAKSAMSLFGSTSPSYPIMASLDLCRSWLDSYGEKAFFQLEEKVKEIKNIAKEKGFSILEGTSDPTRITLGTLPIGFLGTDAAEYFRKNKIEPEYADHSYVVFILTPFNTEKDLKRLKKAIEDIPTLPAISDKNLFFHPPKFVKPLRESILSSCETIEVKKSFQRIAAESICICPPGIPITIPGEFIDESVVKILIEYGILYINVLKSK